MDATIPSVLCVLTAMFIPYHQTGIVKPRQAIIGEGFDLI